MKVFHEIKMLSINENIGDKINRCLRIYTCKKNRRSLTDAMSAFKNLSLKKADSKMKNVDQEI